MEMQEKASWDHGQEESIVSDQQAKCSPQGEREVVQKRTFTRWMNVFLQRCDPPIEVQDLFTDIQDGRVLMALLEELSGNKLLYRFRPSSHHVFRLNNISKALAFLDDRHVKLLGVDASGIADGVPSVVLDLMWNIVLFFQIKGTTGGLQKRFSSSITSLSTSSSLSDLSSLYNDIISSSSSTLPSKGRKAARAPKNHGKAIKTLLHWVQTCTSKFGVEVYDFGKSWRSGLAFLAMIKWIDPALVDLRDSLTKEPKENVHRAFMIAQHKLGIPPLMDTEDVICSSPDERSIITYVSMFLEHYAGVDEEYPSGFETNINVPEIPVFTSSESIGLGESLAQHPEAQALLEGLENTNEQLLWKRWGSGSPRQTKTSSIHLNTSKLSNTKSILSSYKPQSSMEPNMGSVSTPRSKQKNSASATHPNSPLRLDINIVDKEVWSWMEKATEVSCKLCMDDFSHSSEEGMYNLSTLDSDEEEAFSYILELNREVCHSSHEHEGQGTRADMGTRAQLKKGTPKPLNISSGKGSENCHTPHQESSSLTQDNDMQSQPRNRDEPAHRDNMNEKKNGGNSGNEQQEITQDSGLRETVNDRGEKEHSEHEDRSEEEFKERALYVRDDDYDYEEEDEGQEDRENIRIVRQDGEASCQDGVEEEVNVDGVKKKRAFHPESTDGEDTATYMNREKPTEEGDDDDDDDDERNNGVRSSERKELAGGTQAVILGIEAGEEVAEADVRQGSVQRTKERAEFRDSPGVAGTSVRVCDRPMDGCDEGETERSEAEKRCSGHSGGDVAMEKEVREETEARAYFENVEPVKEKRKVKIEEERERNLKGGWVEEGLVGQRETGEQRNEIIDVTTKIKLVEDIAAVNSVKFTAGGQDISTVEVDCGVREVTGVTAENRREAVAGAKDQESRCDSADEDKVEESNGVTNTNDLDEVNAMMKNEEEWQDQEESEKNIYLMEKNSERAKTHQSSAASCEVTASELEILITLWILLYCYFIFPLMQ